MRAFWRWLCEPCAKPLGILLIIGGVIGAGLFTSSFAMIEYSNTAQFCSSCHVMNTPYEEYKTTVHYSNPAGVKAICSDCHVPKDWRHKLVKKVQATAELYYFVRGSISTPEKYEAKRLHMARNVWRSMAANDSRGCRNCHNFSDMKIDRQATKAARMHKKAIDNKHTCIDCHKGIAHRYPDTKPHLQEARKQLEGRVSELAKAGDIVYPIESKRLYSVANKNKKATAVVLAASPLRVVEQRGDWLKISVGGWIKDSRRKVIYAHKGQNIVAASLGRKARKDLKIELEVAQTIKDVRTVATSARPGAPAEAEESAVQPAPPKPGWSRASYTAWMEKSGVLASREPIWRYAAELNELACGKCHKPYEPASFSVNEWPGHMKDMKAYADLEKENSRLLSAYLQYNAKGM